MWTYGDSVPIFQNEWLECEILFANTNTYAYIKNPTQKCKDKIISKYFLLF